MVGTEKPVIGTVADMVPLKDENRIFVKHGLDQLNRSERVGLRALIDVCLDRKSVV